MLRTNNRARIWGWAAAAGAYDAHSFATNRVKNRVVCVGGYDEQLRSVLRTMCEWIPIQNASIEAAPG